MGNVLAQPKVQQHEPVSDLPSVVLKDTLGMFVSTFPCFDTYQEYFKHYNCFKQRRARPVFEDAPVPS
jgi:hypothetical protein